MGLNNQWFVYYSCGVTMDSATVLVADTYEEAIDEAYELACDLYYGFEGLHGVRTIEEIMEEEDVDEIDAANIQIEDREYAIDYYAEPYDPEKHDHML